MPYTTHTQHEHTKHNSLDDVLEWLTSQGDDGETIKVMDGKADITKECTKFLLEYWTNKFNPENHDYARHPLVDTFYDTDDTINEITAEIDEMRDHERLESLGM